MPTFRVHSQLKLDSRPGLMLGGEVESGTIRSGMIIRVADAQHVFVVPIVAVEFVDHANGSSQTALQIAVDDVALRETICAACANGSRIQILEESEAHVPPTRAPPSWTPFECDGRRFEYLAIPTKQKDRPPDWPAHKTFPGRWMPVMVVCVRRPEDKMGPAIVYPAGTVVTVDHAIETARKFWDHLTRSPPR